MKQWAWIIALLYGVLFLLLLWPVTKIAFIHSEEPVNPGAAIISWEFWSWLAILVLAQFALLSVPVDLTAKRPVSKRSLKVPVLVAALLMGLLIFGAALSLGEAFFHSSMSEDIRRVFFSAAGLGWLLWASIFSRWSLAGEPRNFMEKLCRSLFRGSVLELLIVVPAHIVARSRNYCCAGYMTFLGIVCGLAVMLLSFGPGVFFLYARQMEKLRPKKRA